jgi:hypothetical protein
VQIIPLVRAKYVYAYAAVLDRLGAPRWRLLERVGLSDRVLEDPEAIIPARQAWAFIESAALREGIDDLGLVASDMSIQGSESEPSAEGVLPTCAARVLPRRFLCGTIGAVDMVLPRSD